MVWGKSVKKTKSDRTNDNNNIQYMETITLILLTVYALVVLAMVVGLFILDSAHDRSEKEIYGKTIN